MMLPDIPYNLSKERRQIATFAGLNRSEGAADGELTDSVGLSSDDYPALRPRKDDLREENEATDVFEWGGNIVKIHDSVLYFNDTPLCNISGSQKQQYAVVNTKLIVIPENICIDMTNGTYKTLYAETTTPNASGACSFTENGITAELDPKIKSVSEFVTANLVFGEKVNKQYTNFSPNPTVYTYGSDIEAVKACYSDGQWNLNELETLKSNFYADGLSQISVGDIIIPSYTHSSYSNIYKPVLGDASDGIVPDKTQQNTSGYYAIVTRISSEEVEVFGANGEIIKYKNPYISFDVYNAAQTNTMFSSLFSVGDYVSISGCIEPFNNDAAKIVGFDDDTNTVIFADGTFPFSSSSVLYKFNVNIESSTIIIAKNGGSFKRKVTNVPIASDVTLVYSISTTKLYIYNSSGKKLAELDTTESSGSTDIILYAFDDNFNKSISIKRVMPQLDYICSHDNRLFGVSNEDKTIYVSALGLPTIFCDYSGDAGSYSVAVGSNGDFTAICSYGGGVLCFKENSVVKLFGSTPSDFYTNEYTLSGVQNGSYRSLQVVDETLYYKGVYGVYAYTGGLPTLLSAKLGNEIMTDAVAGSDGMHYYICMKNSAKKHVLYVYDIRRGLWLKDREIQVDSFATVSGKLLMAAEDCLYTLHAGDGITHEWMAEFAPFGDVTHEKKTYTTLRLRMDMQRGSYIAVEVQQDRAAWYTAYTQRATDALSLNVPLRIGRCDRLRVRLRGKGDVTVRSMTRELLRGSEV